MHRDAQHDKVMAILSVRSSFCLSGSIIVAQDRDKIDTYNYNNTGIPHSARPLAC